MKLAARDIPRDRIVRRTPRGAVLRITKEQTVIWCSVCEMVSANPSDVEFSYCGRCCKFHSLDPAPAPDPEAA